MRIRVSFSDADMHGHLHNSRYVAYAEDAINEFLRASDLTSRFDPQSSGVVYLVKKVEAVFAHRVRYADEVEVAARVARVGRTSITFEAEFTVTASPGAATPDGPGGAVAAVVSVVWVAVDPGTGGPVPVPAGTSAALPARTQA